MEILTDNEHKVAHQILNQGFAQVEQTFSEISQREIRIKTSNIRLVDRSELPPLHLTKKGVIHLLTTEIIGDLRGKSFLSLQESEVNQLVQLCLPSLSSNNIEQGLVEAMLLELDNMLSANVVTHISNFLEVKIFGDVPKLQVLDVQDAEQQIAQSLTSEPGDSAQSWYLLANVEFAMAGGDPFQPSFVWKFTDQFLQAIKMYVNETAH